MVKLPVEQKVNSNKSHSLLSDKMNICASADGIVETVETIASRSDNQYEY